VRRPAAFSAMTACAASVPSDKVPPVWVTSEGAIVDVPAAAPAPAPAAMAPSVHVAVNDKDLVWGDAPPFLPPGAKAVLVSGDPTKAGGFVIRMKAPAGYKIPAHFHPGDEAVTVLGGTFLIGMGDTFDTSKMKALTAGGYMLMPAGHHHFAACGAGGCYVQVHGTGPFGMTYLNPADDPMKKMH